MLNGKQFIIAAFLCFSSILFQCLLVADYPLVSICLYAVSVNAAFFGLNKNFNISGLALVTTSILWFLPPVITILLFCNLLGLSRLFLDHFAFLLSFAIIPSIILIARSICLHKLNKGKI